MKISVFGLGYVGCVTSACLVRGGHEVIGIDVNEQKVSILNEGKSPIVEEGLEALIADGRKHGKLRAMADPFEAVAETDLSIICVGTPSRANGSLDLDAVTAVCGQIGKGIQQKHDYHCVVLRSTVLPGTTRQVVIPALGEASGLRVHQDFDVCFNPEFLREGTSIKDFDHPPFTIIGQQGGRGGDLVASIYDGVDAPLRYVTYEVAEMVKYACNVYHATKVAFGNEIGVLCKAMGIDSHVVMDLFCLDEKLNISPAYLKPGFAFGGSCLPKDIRALLYKAKEHDLVVPLLSSVFESNRIHVQRATERILAKKKKKIGILGLSFKEGTDDLRESPMVSLVENLIGKGCQVKIYDSDVMVARLFGANKQFIEKEIPHISSLMCQTIEEVMQESEIVVIGKKEQQFKKAVIPFLGKVPIFDVVRLCTEDLTASEGYEGIAW